MALPERKQHHAFQPFADLLDFPFGDWRPFLPPIAAHAQAIRVEDYMEEGGYVVRAELPGIDPAKDVEITVTDDVLRIHAERREEHREAQRSEFRYGSFTRSIALPHGVDAEDVHAEYDQGVLTVRMPVPQAKAEAKKIIVQSKK